MPAASRVPLLALMTASLLAPACIWHGERSWDDPDAGDGADAGNGAGGFVLAGSGGAGMGGSGGMAGSPGIGGNAGGAGGSAVGGASGMGGSAGMDAGSAGAGGSGQGGSIDASQPDTGAADLTPPSDAGSTTCGPSGAPAKLWSFTSDIAGWDITSTSATIAWTGAVGDPAPGALQVNWTGSSAVQPRVVQALGDLQGHVVTARVWVDSGATVAVKVFVQTTSRYFWADGGVVMIPPAQWTCVTLDIDNPVYSRQQYDPTDVEVLGLELQTTGSGRVYIDQVQY